MAHDGQPPGATSPSFDEIDASAISAINFLRMAWPKDSKLSATMTNAPSLSPEEEGAGPLA